MYTAMPTSADPNKAARTAAATKNTDTINVQLQHINVISPAPSYDILSEHELEGGEPPDAGKLSNIYDMLYQGFQ